MLRIQSWGSNASSVAERCREDDIKGIRTHSQTKSSRGHSDNRNGINKEKRRQKPMPRRGRSRTTRRSFSDDEGDSYSDDEVDYIEDEESVTRDSSEDYQDDETQADYEDDDTHDHKMSSSSSRQQKTHGGGERLRLSRTSGSYDSNSSSRSTSHRSTTQNQYVNHAGNTPRRYQGRSIREKKKISREKAAESRAAKEAASELFYDDDEDSDSEEEYEEDNFLEEDYDSDRGGGGGCLPDLNSSTISDVSESLSEAFLSMNAIDRVVTILDNSFGFRNSSESQEHLEKQDSFEESDEDEDYEEEEEEETIAEEAGGEEGKEEEQEGEKQQRQPKKQEEVKQQREENRKEKKESEGIPAKPQASIQKKVEPEPLQRQCSQQSLESNGIEVRVDEVHNSCSHDEESQMGPPIVNQKQPTFHRHGRNCRVPIMNRVTSHISVATGTGIEERWEELEQRLLLEGVHEEGAEAAEAFEICSVQEVGLEEQVANWGAVDAAFEKHDTGNNLSTLLEEVRKERKAKEEKVENQREVEFMEIKRKRKKSKSKRRRARASQ